MSTNVKTLAEALPEEQARVPGLIEIYREIGPAGAFAIAIMEDALWRPDQAAASGDVVAMLRLHKELSEFSV